MSAVQRPGITWFSRWIMVLASVMVGLGAMAAPAAADPKPGIFVPHSKQVGMTGKNLGPLLSDYLAGLLRDKYACAETMTPDDLAALLGWARDQQLLGTPEDQQIKLQDIAGAMGRTGVIVIITFGQVGDGYYVNVRVIDVRTGMPVDNKTVTGEGDDEVLLDLIEELADSLEIPSSQCKWTGAITAKEEFRWNRGRSYTVGSGPEATSVVERHSDNQRDEVTATLLKAGPSPSGESPALVTRTYKSDTEQEQVRTGQINCAAGWNAMAMGTKDYRAWNDSHSSGMSSSGAITEDGSVSINIDSSGHYQIQWQAPALSLRVTTTISAREYPRSQCEAAEDTNYSDDFEVTMDPRDFFAEGDVDPSNRNVLTGTLTTSEEMPDGDSGQMTRTTTMRWYFERSGG